MREEAQKGRVSGSVQWVSSPEIINDNLTQLFICQENNMFLIYINFIHSCFIKLCTGQNEIQVKIF